MLRALRFAVPLAVLALALAVAGCASINQLALLRTASFAFAGVSDVRLVGIPIGPAPTTPSWASPTRRASRPRS